MSNDITTIDGSELGGDELESRLRAACQAVIPHLLDSPPGADVGRGILSDVVAFEAPRRRTRVATLAAAVVVAVAIAAAIIVAAGRRQADQLPAAPVASLPASTSSNVEDLLSCDDFGCHGFDDLPVVAGADDYFVGPESLGEPHFDKALFEQTTRCTSLTDDLSACAAIEGDAGVSLVSYSVEHVTTTAAATGDTVFDTTGSQVGIGTTFTEITPAQYASRWGQTKGGDQAHTAITVRGHEGIRYSSETSPAVVWQERPGVLVWVVVPPAYGDQLMSIAEGVRSATGLASIPHRVSIRSLGHPWDANDNNGDSVLLGRAGGVECFGFGFIEQCGQQIADRTAVVNLDSGGVLVAGSTPADVTRIRVTQSDGSSPIVPTTPVAGFTSRAFAVPVAGQVTRLEWLDAAGNTVATVDHPQSLGGVAVANGAPAIIVTTVDGAAAKPTATASG